MTKAAVGIDLGGTYIKAGCVDADGEVLSKAKVETKGPGGPGVVVGQICLAVDRALDAAGLKKRDVAGVGVGSPGALDLVNGVVHEAPNLPGFTEIPLRDMVRKRCGVKCLLENDANAAAQGENWAGAGRRAHSLIMLTLGTGVGGGIVLNGRVWHGHNGTAGELGHVTLDMNGPLCGCGNRGCLETYASATGMVRRMREAISSGAETTLKNKKDSLTSKDIYDAAMAGDKAAAENMRMTGFYLGIALVSILYAFNPQVVVLSGGVTAAGDMLMDPIKGAVQERVIKACWDQTDIRFAELGQDAGFIGAAACVLSESETFA